MREFGAVCCLAMSVVLLAGCGEEPSDSRAGGDTTAGRSACAERLAESAALRSVGEIADDRATDVGGLPACQATVAQSDEGIERLQLVQVPSERWARSLPGIIEDLLASGTVQDQTNLTKLRAGLEMLESGADLSAKEACGLFTTMVVALQGLEPGAVSVVNVLPDRRAPQAVNGQACSDGVYTGVQVEGSRGLDADPGLIDRVGAALDDYHDGPL